MEKAVILYVDDEEQQLYLFRRFFESHFRVLTAQSGKEGLEILQREPVEIVIADERMEPMGGTEFLAEAQRLAPQIPRMMLTAYQSENLLLRAVNEGGIAHYVRKPIDGKEAEILLILRMLLMEQAQKKILERQNEELRKAVLDLKLVQEKAIALDRLEHRYRVINELGHNLRNPFTPVYTCYQILGEMEAKCRREKVSDSEKLQMFDQAMKVIEIAAPQMERLYEELRHIGKFIQDETDPVGDGVSPKKKNG